MFTLFVQVQHSLQASFPLLTSTSKLTRDVNSIVKLCRTLALSSSSTGSFNSDSPVVVVHEQSAYTVEPGKIHVRTFQVLHVSFNLVRSHRGILIH